MEYIMKLSEQTIEILKNFGTINESIMFQTGKVIRTVSKTKNILAEFKSEDEVTKDFSVYDLNNFLAVLTMFNGTEIELEENACKLISADGRNKLKYYYCDPEMITLAPSKPIAMPEAEIQFTFTKEDYNHLKRITNVLGTSDVAVKSDGSKVSILAFDTKNDASATNELVMCDGNGDVYNILFKMQNFVMYPGNYIVNISSKGVSNFKHAELELNYWITSEPGSTFTKG